MASPPPVYLFPRHYAGERVCTMLINGRAGDDEGVKVQAGEAGSDRKGREEGW